MNKKGDFSFIKDNLSRRAFHNLYIAITETNNWDWLSKFEPETGKGFMFTRHTNLIAIENALDQSDSANGHSGASWAWALRNMEYIASFGWDDFVTRWKKQNPPKPEKEFCSAMEVTGLVNAKNMDENNKKAWNVMKNEGTEAAVKHMFQHPTEKDSQGNPVIMDYSTMRSYYG